MSNHSDSPGWQPIKLVEDHPDTARIRAALYATGAGTILRGRTYIGDEAGEYGRLTVYREVGEDEDEGEDEVVGLAVAADDGWYLGCTECRAQLRGADAGRCAECRAVSVSRAGDASASAGPLRRT